MDKKTFSVCYFSATSMEISQLSAGARLLSEESPDFPFTVSARTAVQLFDELRRREFIKAAFRHDVLIINLHGGAESFPAWEEFEKEMAKNPRPPFIHVQPSSSDADGLAWAAKWSTGFKSEEYDKAHFYLSAGGRDNFKELIKFFANSVLGLSLPVAPPALLPFEGIYHPDWPGAADQKEYMAGLDPKKPTIGIWFHQVYWINGNLRHIDELIRQVEKSGANALAVFHMRFKDKDLKNMGSNAAARKFFMDESGKAVINALLSAMSFSMTLSSPDTKGLFADMGVPVIQACQCFSPREAWSESWQGLPSMDVYMSSIRR